jgi:hypothetical protein
MRQQHYACANIELAPLGGQALLPTATDLASPHCLQPPLQWPAAMLPNILWFIQSAMHPCQALRRHAMRRGHMCKRNHRLLFLAQRPRPQAVPYCRKAAADRQMGFC